VSVWLDVFVWEGDWDCDGDCVFDGEQPSFFAINCMPPKPASMSYDAPESLDTKEAIASPNPRTGVVVPPEGGNHVSPVYRNVREP